MATVVISQCNTVVW